MHDEDDGAEKKGREVISMERMDVAALSPVSANDKRLVC
jgi:hypothetical protein